MYASFIIVLHSILTRIVGAEAPRLNGIGATAFQVSDSFGPEDFARQVVCAPNSGMSQSKTFPHAMIGRRTYTLFRIVDKAPQPVRADFVRSSSIDGLKPHWSDPMKRRRGVTALEILVIAGIVLLLLALLGP